MLRIRDGRESIYSFQDEFLVKCPRCNGLAKVRRVDPDDTDLFAPRSFSCKSCGASKDWTKGAIGRPWYDEAVDDYFNYRLWLQAPCCGHTLWAYNLRHLDFIEAYARSQHRERSRDDRYGWSNRSLFSRLPKWMQSRKNRNEIIKAILKIRGSL